MWKSYVITTLKHDLNYATKIKMITVIRHAEIDSRSDWWYKANSFKADYFHLKSCKAESKLSRCSWWWCIILLVKNLLCWDYACSRTHSFFDVTLIHACTHLWTWALHFIFTQWLTATRWWASHYILIYKCKTLTLLLWVPGSVYYTLFVQFSNSRAASYVLKELFIHSTIKSYNILLNMYSMNSKQFWMSVELKNKFKNSNPFMCVFFFQTSDLIRFF